MEPKQIPAISLPLITLILGVSGYVLFSNLNPVDKPFSPREMLKPSIDYIDLSRSAIRADQALLEDSAPLFLPTRWNASTSPSAGLGDEIIGILSDEELLTDQQIAAGVVKQFIYNQDQNTIVFTQIDPTHTNDQGDPAPFCQLATFSQGGEGAEEDSEGSVVGFWEKQGAPTQYRQFLKINNDSSGYEC